eukprot:825052-Prymnesium_polylepis.2
MPGYDRTPAARCVAMSARLPPPCLAMSARLPPPCVAVSARLPPPSLAMSARLPPPCLAMSARLRPGRLSFASSALSRYPLDGPPSVPVASCPLGCLCRWLVVPPCPLPVAGLGFENSAFRNAANGDGSRKGLIELKPVTDADGSMDEVRDGPRGGRGAAAVKAWVRRAAGRTWGHCREAVDEKGCGAGVGDCREAAPGAGSL